MPTFKLPAWPRSARVLLILPVFLTFVAAAYIAQGNIGSSTPVATNTAVHGTPAAPDATGATGAAGATVVTEAKVVDEVSGTAGNGPTADVTPVPPLKNPSLAPTATPVLTIPRPAVPKVVALDPGHGGDEIGAVATSGKTLAEKDVNLDIATRLKPLLEAAGYRVVLTRDGDHGANYPPIKRTPGGTISLRDDLQARVDIADEAQADIFVSIHNNAAASPSTSGTEVWYSGERPFGDKNQILARELQASLLSHLSDVGYRSVDRGIKDDSTFRVINGQAYNIFVLGPARESFHPRATSMPGALGETLFLSNPVEANLLRRADVLDAIAAGYLAGIQRFFALTSGS